MPKKTHLAMSDFLEAALDMVKKDGWKTLSITALAKHMGCSTMPVYSHFKDVDTLKDSVVKKGWELVSAYESKQYTGDAWIDPAIGYVLFARENNKLFGCMLDGRNLALERQMLQTHWNSLTDRLNSYPGFKNLSREQCRVIRYSRAMLTQGVATSASKGIGKLLTDTEAIQKYMTISSHTLLEGVRNIYEKDELDIKFLDEHFQPIGGL